MKEMILDNAKMEGELYIVQDLLQDGKPMASWNMRGTVLKMQKIQSTGPGQMTRGHGKEAAINVDL